MSDVETELGPLDHLVAVSSGKPFENLSWRLLQLLVKDVVVDRRELGEGDRLTISNKIDAIYVERGSLKLKSWPGGPDGWNSSVRMLDSGSTATLSEFNDLSKTAPSLYLGTLAIVDKQMYQATDGTVLRVFYKPGQEPKRNRLPLARGATRAKPRKRKNESAWDWLCKRSVVARKALLRKDTARGEVVLLKSKDLVEYLPALTELLAQAMSCGSGSGREEPALVIRLARYEKGAKRDRVWLDVGPDHRIEFHTVGDPNDLVSPEITDNCTYAFLDPYDRASDLAAIQVKTLKARGRASDAPGTSVKEYVPGSSLTKDEYGKVFDEVDSVVNVARNFRIDTEGEDTDKLNFYAVVLDSRTARFESGGTRDRTQRRNADDPVRSKVEPPEGCDDAAPSTRLHLNLLRLKKAWEQSPAYFDVCDVLDEPNIPATGDRQGYWSARTFFERWVRDLRFRRVGVALGGGGATGFAHVALLNSLREENISIDLVSGTSFGALVGAYYCSHGLDGLQMLTEQSLLYTGVASLTMITSAFFEHLVNISIDYRPMWELPIPLYAVATDIETGRMVVFPGPAAANPSVGFAVRASGALPGFFAPAVAGDARYVDGAAVSNVPVRALIRFGADVIIGSNAFPFRKSAGAYKPTPLRGFLPPPFGRLAERILAELNPGNRMTDAARSLSLSLTDVMEKETLLASAVYEHKRTDVKYWEFHRAGRVLRGAMEDLVTSGAMPAAINAVRLLNSHVDDIFGGSTP